MYGTNHKTIRCQSCSQLNRSICNVLYKLKAAVGNQDKENKQPISSNSVNWKLLSDEEKDTKINREEDSMLKGEQNMLKGRWKKKSKC